MTGICKNCGKEFILTPSQEKRIKINGYCFCSKSCASKYNSKFKNPSTWIKKDSSGKFINKNTEQHIGICNNCGKEFKLSKHQYNRMINNLPIYCCKSCSAKISNRTRNDNWKQTRKNTNKLKYNNENYVNKDKISKSINKLYQERDDYGFSSETFKNKMIEKYNVDNISKSEWLKQYNIKTYGTQYYFQSEDYKNKTRNTNINKYGCLYHMQNKDQVDKYRQTVKERYGVDWITDVPEVMNKIKQGLKNTYTNQNNNLDTNRYVSKINKHIGQILKDNNIEFQYEYFIQPCWYDIKVGNTLLEIDPTITHNIVFNPFGKSINSTYHRSKTLLAEKNNFNCIHIFDWDNIDKIIYLITPHKKLYARKCNIMLVNTLNTNSFLNTYHIQGTCKGQIINLGLYDGNELVQLMTFGKPRYNKNYEWELLRLCSKYTIIGGAEKLFKYFINTYDPKSIISYCDRSKFRGTVYGILGFTLKTESKGSLHWFNIDTHRHITNNLLLQRGYSQLHNDNNYTQYSKGDNNEQLMLENNYLPVYDCGQSTYIWLRDTT